MNPLRLMWELAYVTWLAVTFFVSWEAGRTVADWARTYHQEWVMIPFLVFWFIVLTYNKNYVFEYIHNQLKRIR